MHGMVIIGMMRSTVAVALGVSLVLAGASLALNWSTMLNTFLAKQLAIEEGTLSFEHWKETPVPMYIDIYFHNWTNPKQVRMEKPKFTQMGPYRFYEKRTKVDMLWNYNRTVSYKQTRHWFFDADNSNGSLSDLVTTVNVVSLTAAYTSRFKDFFERKAVSYGLTAFSQNIHVTKSIEQLLFGGYQDDLLTMANYLPASLKNGGPRTTDKFGWFYQRNGSAEVDGVFNMATGEGDLGRVGEILSWNYVNKTDYFDGKCGHVQGFSGEIFPPGLTSSSRLALFSPDLCRPVYLSYAEKSRIYGIPGLKFTGGEQMFDSGALNPDNKCYCRGECSAPWGLLNATACRFGVPIFVSYPHFFNADPALLDQVRGMEPDEDKHSFQLIVEPNYGFPMDLKARFQLNLMIEPLEDYRLYSDIPNRLFMPIFWFDQRAGLTSSLSISVWLILALPYIGYAIASCLMLSGVITAFVQVLKFIRTLNQANKQTTQL